MKYYLIAGERSGDLHAANLVRALRANDPRATVRAWAGEQTEAAGATLVKHYRELAFMGFWEVVTNLRTIRGLLAHCKADLLAWQPDAVILVDYAGFNLRIARFARAAGLPVFYYISPKVWAWNQGRAHNIKKWVTRMFVIFPFEKAFYARYGFAVDYVGNPLMDAIAAHHPDPTFRAHHQLTDRPIVALLPGSRRQEVAWVLPLMHGVAARFPEYQFVVAAVSNLPVALYAQLAPGLPLVTDTTYDLLDQARAALVTSGTATLETALLDVPQVVCYRTSAVSYAIARRLIRVPYISLVNLVAEKAVVRELIQDELTVENLTAALGALLEPNGEPDAQNENPSRMQQLADYATLHQRVGGPGASARAGKLMVDYLREILVEKATQPSNH